jgi:uncharacterized protein (DUF2126 family)
MLLETVPDAAAFARALAAHDEALAARGLDIWLGNEPTFTLRESTAPEWLTEAIGADKVERAKRLLIELAADAPSAVLVRSLGRKYAGEPSARFSFGLYARRDGAAIYSGPRDPWLAPDAPPPDLERFQRELSDALSEAGLICRPFNTAQDRRLVFARSSASLLPTPVKDPRLLRDSLHRTQGPGPMVGDDLTASGLFLLVLRGHEEGSAELELPAVPDVELFCTLLSCVAEAGNAAGLGSLVLCGFPPPVSEQVGFLTVTPDPAVVEINMAPSASISEFWEQNRKVYAAAASAGLSPFRLRHNGVVADSGGAGQITFGGPSPLASPFLKVPQLLPRLLRYVLRHPALSYLFAHDYVGASGQSVRPDELGADMLTELYLALSLLDAQPDVDPITLWQSLAPCLTDPTGNAHRAELNVEKLWNPSLPHRGQLGLVELRALRMQDTPERAAALGALWRSLIASLMVRDYREEPPEHGALLHDRYALPFFLELDLEEILADLRQTGFGLGATLEQELRRDSFRLLARVKHGPLELTLRRGLEFWPLVGDASLQQGTSRLVDASTSRLELVVRAATPEHEHLLANARVSALGRALPLRGERDHRGAARVFGLRYRCYRPLQGLHPLLGEQSPLLLRLSHPELPGALELALHDWKAGGGAYENLPHTPLEAEQRCAERCLVTAVAPEDPPSVPVHPRALTAYSLDLRRAPPTATVG